MRLGRFLKHFASAVTVASVIVVGGGAATAQPPKVVQINSLASPYGVVPLCGATPANVMTGTLDGCWYTDTVADNGNPIWGPTPNDDGTFTQSFAGTEHFVGCVHLQGPAEIGVNHCGPSDLTGTWITTFVFNEVVDAGGNEISGGCDHPIFQQSGTGDFTGVSGAIFMSDNVTDGTSTITGSISLPRSSHQQSANTTAAPAAVGPGSLVKVHC